MVADRASTTNHVLIGGFHASLDASTTGKPWLSAANPRFTAMRSRASVTLYGTQMKSSSSVTIGGQSATVLSRTHDQITVRVPDQSVPGFRPVTVKGGSGETTLPQGLGILPMPANIIALADGSRA